MHFQHADEIWADFPELVAGALVVEGVTRDASVGARLAAHQAVAASRLETVSESELPEIKAWRRAFAAMGLKPTQYRCAAEALLRRFRKEGTLPQIHPVIDLCNALSLAFAIPVAVFDVARVSGHLEVRRATGAGESYLAFSGETVAPDVGEVIFADAEGTVHARRWTNRQSASSAVRDDTSAVLVVAEALHETAPVDVRQLMKALVAEMSRTWPVTPTSTILSRSAPRFEW